MPAIEYEEEWPDLLAYWTEQGYKYDYKIRCFTRFDSFKGVTDWMTVEGALQRAVKEMDDE